MGTRCGYCSVSMSHPFYRKNYGNDAISDLKHTVDEVISVHGGVTYSGFLEMIINFDDTIPRDLWWFGFDCCHANDAQDPELITDPQTKKFVMEMEERFASRYDSHYKRTHKKLEYVIENCNNMAEHLSKFLYSSVDFIMGEETSLRDVSKVI